MHTKDAIKFALTVSNGAVLSVVDEMSDAATTFPTPNGGCHFAAMSTEARVVSQSICRAQPLPDLS